MKKGAVSVKGKQESWDTSCSFTFTLCVAPDSLICQDISFTEPGYISLIEGIYKT